MKTPRTWVIVGGLTGVLAVASAGTGGREAQRTRDIVVQREGSTAGVWVPQGPSPSFVPDQIIVKYRDSVTEPVERLVDRGRPFRSATTDSSDSLDRLHGKYGARAARPVFREAVSGRAGFRAPDQAAVRRRQAERLEAVRRRFPRRAARAAARDLPDLSHVYAVTLAPGSDVAQAAAEFAADPHVAYAHPNFRASAQSAPNDPYYSSSGSWGQPYGDLWGLGRIEAETAWSFTLGDGIVVAVVDTGLDPTHPDIAANVWTNPLEVLNGADDDGNGYVDDVRGWDFAYGDNDITDRFGHGTHVSGTIAATGDNGLGIVGVAPHARVMAVKGLDDNGSGSFDALAAALVYAAQNGADVINNSWGCSTPCPSIPVVEDAVRTVHAFGVVPVFAAGNSQMDVFNISPQNTPEALVVAASTNLDHTAFFSNFGAGLDVAAPGAGENAPPPDEQPYRGILSLKSATCIPGLCPPELIVGGQYLRQAGTSMAAPHAAGVAALVLAARPAFTVEQVRQAMRRGGADAGDFGFDDRFGYGRLSAAGALAEAAPLEALITNPTATTLSGVTHVDVRGAAGGPGFASWLLDYGAGTLPGSWTQIAGAATPVPENGGVTSWDISTLRDGVYTLRLTATNASGQTYEDRQRVTVDQVAISQPPPEGTTVFRGGEVITVTGTASPATFSHYNLVVRNRNGAVVGNAAISLTNGGLQPVVNGTLGTWNTAGIPADRYSIALEVTLADDSLISESTPVIVDPTLHPGWPKPLGLFVSFAILAITDHLDAADVNLDGRADLVVGYGTTVRIYDHTGASLPGWPQSIDPDGTGHIIQRSPAVGDLDGDGIPEVAACTNSGRIFVWSSTGVLLPGWPYGHGGGSNGISIADVDGNGTNEIVTTDGTRVDVLSVSGASLPGWPRFLSGATGLSPAVVGDVDGDGRSELAVLDLFSPNNLYLLGSDGTTLPGWPRATNPSIPNGLFFSYPAMGELDGDPTREIVVGAADGRVLVLNSDGTNAAGWPRTTAGVPVSSPAVGDIDGDGLPEVVAGLTEVIENGATVNLLYAWRRDGTLLPGWPVRYDGPIHNYFFGVSAASLADVNGDGRADVIASNEAPDPLNAYGVNGTILPGFPKPTSAGAAWEVNTPAVADLDGDGLLEMAWIDFSGMLYVWDLPGGRSGPRPWPMFHADARHAGRSDPLQVVAASDFQTPAGSIVSGSYADTRNSDNIWEVLSTERTRGTTQLRHTWRFDNVPAAAHTLVIEGFRPANAAGDSFRFLYSTDNASFSLVPGSVVSSASESRIEVPFGPPSLGRTVYIRVENVVTSGSKNRTINLDYLAIGTVPYTGP